MQEAGKDMLLEECADAGYRLLQQALDSAIVIAQNHFSRGERLLDPSKGAKTMKNTDPHLKYVMFRGLFVMRIDVYL